VLTLEHTVFSISRLASIPNRPNKEGSRLNGQFQAFPLMIRQQVDIMLVVNITQGGAVGTHHPVCLLAAHCIRQHCYPLAYGQPTFLDVEVIRR